MVRHLWKALPALLMATFPVWRLQAQPESWSQILSALRVSLIVIAISLLLIWMLKALIADVAKRAVVIAIFWGVAYLLSPMTRLLVIPTLRNAHVDFVWLTSVEVMRNAEVMRVLSLVCLTATLLPVIVLLRRSKSNFSVFTLIVNTFLGVMLILSAGQTALWFASNQLELLESPTWSVAADTILGTGHEQNLQPAEERPDIYFIVVDGYARSDVLEQYYGMDNQEFLSDLADRGFQTTNWSQSNYAQTYLSLAASLNMNYLDPLQETIGVDSSNREPLRYLIRHNSVAQLLRRIGYKYVLVPSAFLLSAAEGPLVDLCLCEGASEDLFVWQYLKHTMAGWWLPSQSDYVRHRDGIENVLRSLAAVPEADQPQFVFAHILAPHPPFVFMEDGSLRENWYYYSLNDGTGYFGSQAEYVEGYRDQAAYLNRRLLETVDSILARAKTPPIILIQADHGPGSMLDWDSMDATNLHERLSIFSSFHLPGEKPVVDDDITPVNNFRMLFNQYFGAHFAMLENRSYYATWPRPYAWEEFIAVQP